LRTRDGPTEDDGGAKKRLTHQLRLSEPLS
jgi:hypothetical protein